MKKPVLNDNPDTFTLEQWFIMSCYFSLLLLCARVVATGYTTYVFLLWNLFLAFIPYAITEWLDKKAASTMSKLKLIALASAWLLFIPNSFYILTDLFHLHEMSSAPRWFDLLLLTSFACNGLFLGMASLQKMERILLKLSGRIPGLLIIFTVMSLNAYGIYIGRFLRYNSWDVVAQPFPLMADLFRMLVHPFQNMIEWGMIFCYAVFMTLLYMILKKMSAGISQLQNQ